jgi:glutathione S-transferase
MILVGQYDSPYVRRIAVTLGLYGMPFRRNPISVFTDAAAMARINPLVRIPSLVLDDGEALIDSAAILDHLDEVAGPGKALMPRDGAARRQTLQVVVAATGAIDKAGAVVYERHFHAPAAVASDWVARCKGQLAGALAWLEQRLAADWFVDGRLSQADVTVACMIGYLKLRLPEMLAEASYPRLENHAARCEAMDAFRAARPSPDEVMPS